MKKMYVSHGQITHSLNEPCDYCRKVEKDYEEAIKSEELKKIIGTKLFNRLRKDQKELMIKTRGVIHLKKL